MANSKLYPDFTLHEPVPICKRNDSCDKAPKCLDPQQVSYRTFALGSLIFECGDLPQILEVLSPKLGSNTIGQLLNLNKEVVAKRINRDGKKKCYHNLYYLITTAFLNPDFASSISTANLAVILQQEIHYTDSDFEPLIDVSFEKCKIDDWCYVFATLQNISLKIANAEGIPSMEIYMYCVGEIVKHPLWIQKMLEDCIQLRCGPLKHLATRVTIENYNWLMSKLKLVSTIDYTQRLFCSPSVIGKCVALFQLLEIHEVAWKSINLAAIESLIPTLYTILEWIFDKCVLFKDKTVQGFRWISAKFRREHEEEDKFPGLRSDLPETPDMAVASVQKQEPPCSFEFVPQEIYLSRIMHKQVDTEAVKSYENNCLFDSTCDNPKAIREQVYNMLKDNRPEVLEIYKKNGFDIHEFSETLNAQLDRQMNLMDEGKFLDSILIPLIQDVIGKRIILYRRYQEFNPDRNEMVTKIVAHKNPDTNDSEALWVENQNNVHFAKGKKTAYDFGMNWGGERFYPEEAPKEEIKVTEKIGVPTTNVPDGQVVKFVEDLESTETGRTFLDWLKQSCADIYQFFKENAIIGGALAFVFSIASSLGITISTFKNNGDKKSFWKNLSESGKDFYYLSRGKDSVLGVFKDFGDILRDLLGIDATPELNAFKVALLEAADGAEKLNQICQNNPAQISNDPQQIVVMKKQIDNIRARYNELTKFNTSVNLQALQPVWVRITAAYTQLQTNYYRFCNHIETRKVPVCVWFWGRSNIGKSEMIRKFFHKVNLAQGTAWEIFTVSKGPDYLNGFQQQKIILIDDFDSFSMMEGCLDALLLLNMVTSAPYNPNMAALQDKDLNMMPELIGISSNFPTCKLNCGVNDMEAFERRRDYVINVTWPDHSNCDITEKSCSHWKAVKEKRDANQEMSFDHLTLIRNHSLFYSNANIFKDKRDSTPVPKYKPCAAMNPNKAISLGETNLDELVESVVAQIKEHEINYQMQLKELAEVKKKAVKVESAEEAIGVSGSDWHETPNILLTGPPGTGKSFVLNMVADELKNKAKYIKTIQEFDQGAAMDFCYQDVTHVLFDDFTTFKSSAHAHKFWKLWKERADVKDDRRTTWILGSNRKVTMSFFSSEEEYDVHTRADRCTEYIFTFRNKPQHYMASWFVSAPLYTAQDVNECATSGVPHGQIVRISGFSKITNKFEPVLHNELVKRMIAHVPAIRMKYSQLRLPKVGFLPQVDCIVGCKITSQEFIALINSNGNTDTVLNLITGGSFKSMKFTKLNIGKRVMTTFRNMTYYHGCEFSDMDSFMLCGSNNNFFKGFADGTFVLEFIDKRYCLYPENGRVIAALYDPVDIQKDIGELAQVVAESVNTFDFLKVNHSTLPPWTVLALGILEVTIKTAMTTASAAHVIIQNKAMFKAVAARDIMMERTEQYYSDEISEVPKRFSSKLDVEKDWSNANNQSERNRKAKTRPSKIVKLRQSHRGTRASKVGVEKLDLTKESVEEVVGATLTTANEIMDTMIPEVQAEIATDNSVYDAIGAIYKNLVTIVRASDGAHVVNGLMYSGKKGTTVGHLCYPDNDLSKFLVKDIDGKKYPMKYLMRENETDRLDFEIVGSKQFPSITKQFTKFENEFFKNKLCVMVQLNFVNEIPSLIMRFFRIGSFDKVELSGYYKAMTWSFHGAMSGMISDLPPQTIKGDCGAVVLLCDPTRGQKVIGMHVASDKTHGYFRAINSEMYSSKVEPNCAEPEMKGTLGEFEEPRYPSKEGIPVVARCTKKPFLPSKTRLYRSPFAWGVCEYEPSVLSPEDPRAPDIPDMVYKESKKWLTEPIKYTPEQVRDINEKFSIIGDWLGQKLRNYGIITSTLTKRAALNAVRGYTHSKPIPVSTSAGYPLNQVLIGGKTPIINVSKEDGSRTFTDDVVMKSVVHDEIDHIIKKAKQGELADIAFQVFPKDELLSKEKLKVKTRTIAAAPFALVVALRMYFHTTYAALSEIWSSIPIKVGLSGNSLDWTVLTKRLLGAGPEGFSIDQTDFDFTVPRELSEGVVHCLNAIIAHTDEDDTGEKRELRTNLHRNVSEFKIIVNGLVYQSTKGVPSGHPGTATENSIISLFCLFDAFSSLAPDHVCNTITDFFNSVEACVYGDDALCTVHPGIQSWFNLQTVAEFLSTKYGMKITTSDKSKELYTVKPLVELDFLSRSFVPFGHYFIGPLNMKRLVKPLNFCRGNRPHHWFKERDKITDELAFAYEAASSALDEMFFHGEEKYESLRKHLLKVAEEYSITEAYFPPYQVKYHDFFDLRSASTTGFYTHMVPVDKSLMTKLTAEKGWFSYRSRRCLLLGTPYSWDRRSEGKAVEMPLYVCQVLRRVNQILDTDYNQILVNEYRPGGFIDWHKDDETGLDLSLGVASLTISGDGLMQWKDEEERIVGAFECSPGSLYQMTGSYVLKYKHRRIDHTKYTMTLTFRKISTSQ